MKYFIIIVAVFIFGGCSSTTNPGNKTQEQNIATTKSLFEHFNKHDWKKMADLYADPAEFKDPSFGIEAVQQTRLQTVEKYTGYQKFSPDINDSIAQIYPSGDKYVTVEFISTGTGPDGKKWRLPICTIFTIENGLIIKDNTYYDNK